jgi:hypothetical protein
MQSHLCDALPPGTGLRRAEIVGFYPAGPQKDLAEPEVCL